ncbi:hypothetical protein ACWGKQ_16065 [Streptomyces sp. NPDC054770]
MTRRGVASILTEAGGFAVTASTPDPAELGDLGVFDLILVDLFWRTTLPLCRWWPGWRPPTGCW